MYFVIWKPKDKFTSFTNVLFATEKEATEFMEKNKKRKIEFKVVPYDTKRTTINIGISNYCFFICS